MATVSLQEAIGLTINEWFGGSAIDVYRTMDACVAVMASIAVKAGCNTDERVAVVGAAERSHDSSESVFVEGVSAGEILRELDTQNPEKPETQIR